MKVYSKILFVLMLSFALVGLSGCSEKEKATTNDSKKTAETKGNTTENKKSEAQTNPKNEEKEINDFVLKNTKVVKIFNISRRMNEQHPDLGPFFVVRGIDERGQKSEIWIKDMKVFEMINTK